MMKEAALERLRANIAKRTCPRCGRFGIPSWHKCYPVISRLFAIAERWLVRRRMKRDRESFEP